MPPPSRRHLDALSVCLDAGSVKEAAYVQGISYLAMRSLLMRLYRQLGVTNLAQAVYVCDQRYPGWRHKMASPTPQDAVSH
jgi:hypothetical protein